MCAKNRRDEQGCAKMEDRRRGKGLDLFRTAVPSGLGEQRDDHELKSDQRRGRRANDYVKALPGGKGRSRRFVHD